jgi:predicted patatin/cPLA2 family phospholipase
MTEPASRHAALIVEGGAMRGVFAVGVLSSFVERGFFPFDFCIGVSSGAVALAFSLLGRPDLALRTFTECAASRTFVSFSRFVRGGDLLDLDGMVGQVERELALLTHELALLRRSPWRAPFYVCVTDVESGQPRYLETRPDNLVSLLHATTAMPWLYRGFPPVEGRPATDGGASDAIPVSRALELGATRIVVVRSRPREYVKRDTWGHRLVRWKVREHPALRATMGARAERFQEVVTLMRKPPAGVQIVEICPPTGFALGRFGRDLAALHDGYAAGREAGREAIRQWSQKGDSLGRPVNE